MRTLFLILLLLTNAQTLHAAKKVSVMHGEETFIGGSRFDDSLVLCKTANIGQWTVTQAPKYGVVRTAAVYRAANLDPNPIQPRELHCGSNKYYFNDVFYKWTDTNPNNVNDILRMYWEGTHKGVTTTTSVIFEISLKNPAKITIQNISLRSGSPCVRIVVASVENLKIRQRAV